MSNKNNNSGSCYKYSLFGVLRIAILRHTHTHTHTETKTKEKKPQKGVPVVV